MRARARVLLDERLVHVAPAPVFPGLERLDDRVAGRVRVPACVAVRGRVAAADMAAGHAQAQMHPARPGPQALLAALRGPGCDRADLYDVRAGRRRRGRVDHATASRSDRGPRKKLLRFTAGGLLRTLMASLTHELFDVPTSARTTRALEAAADRIDEVLGGHTLWNATPQPAELDAMTADDVVILDDWAAAALAPTLRDHGTHVVIRTDAGRRELVPVSPVDSACIDAYLVVSRTGGRVGVDRVTAFIPACRLAVEKVSPAVGAMPAHLRGIEWSAAVAEVVRSDREETVGGTLQPRPSVAAR
jgi:hypothetical protein